MEVDLRKRKTQAVLIALPIAFVLLLIPFNINIADGTVKATIHRDFVDCLSSKSVIYIHPQAKYVREQKILFGTEFGKLRQVDCEKNRNYCAEIGIKGYPTWVIEGKVYEGFRSIENLKEISGCDG